MGKDIFMKLFLISVVMVSALLVVANDSAKSGESALFKVCRSKDANEIFYTLKTTNDGTLDLKEPINIFWIKCSKKGKTEPLTKIQQQYAYGLNYLLITPESADFHFVSFPEKTLKLRKNKRGSYCVFTDVRGKEMELEQVFVQFDGGTFLMPKISKVELRAKNPEMENFVVEIIHP